MRLWLQEENAARFYGVPWATLLLGTFIAGAFPRVAQEGSVPFLLCSSLLFGMPHGAGDMLVLQGAAGKRGLSKRAARVLLALYLPLVVLVLVLWKCNTLWALGLFLALTVWHWGSADAFELPRASPASWTLLALGRGLLVISAPLALHPLQSGAFLQEFAVSAPGHALNTGWATKAAPGVLALALVLHVGAWAHYSRHATGTNATASANAPVWASAIETALLLGLFAVSPPLWAITCYFVGVHSWRHIWRVESLCEGTSHFGTAPDVWRALWRFHRRVLPVTLLALLGLLPVVMLWPQFHRGATNPAAAYLILISALTLPHALLIGTLDWLIWKRGARNPFSI